VDPNTTVELSERTFGNEDRLPRVPLPSLEESCDRFLTWCEPLLTAAELASTKNAVSAFQRPDSPARELHAALEEYNASEGVHSWLDAFWPYRYLGRRDRIALNANFFFLFKEGEQEQVERAAGLIAAAVNYKLQLDAEQIPPLIQHGQVLSMEQNKYLFSACRIPGPLQDTVRAPYSPARPGPSQERHIVVFFRGHMFRMDVIGPYGRPFTLDDLRAGLRGIMAAGATPAAPGTSVGHLTTKARAEWAASRRALLDCHAANAQLLDTVETALLCICLDDVSPANAQVACDQLLHGDSGNRWFDKPISLIVFANGMAGYNGEHSELDGTTVVAFIDSLLSDSAEGHARRAGAQSQGRPPFARLDFELDADLKSDVQQAAAAFADYAADNASCVLSFEDCGAKQIKQLRMSPDAFVQMAYQVAHRRARGLVGATYEAIATRQFRHGRTEAMRVVTPEVLRFVAAMDDPEADRASRRAAFRAAAEKHVQRAKDCQAGRAPEQHLWELQLMQRRRGAALGVTEPLALYETAGWLTMRDDYLSTSSAPSASTQYFGFGSTGAKCIGVAYVLLPDRFNLYLSSPRAQNEELRGFADELRAAVRELHDLLATEPQVADEASPRAAENGG